MSHFTKSIIINTPVAHVRDTMLNHPTYEQRTSVFQQGSTYQGSWNKGDTIKFVDQSGQGMSSVIAESRKHEFVSIKHGGQMMINESGDLTMTTYDSPMYENYSFAEEHDATHLTITMQGLPEEYVAMFDKMWPDALEKLKEICEANQ